MENDQHIRQIALTASETIVEIKKPPSMGFVFLKALMISPFRSSTIADDAVVDRTRIVLNGCRPDKEQIKQYRSVCGFSQNQPDIIPISYLQTLFIGLLGRFIISPFFPISPLGLIQIFQSFEQKRPVFLDETLDLSCAMDSITKSEKGTETRFILEIRSGGDIVWQGLSTYFTRSPVKKEKTSKKKDEVFLEKKETIPVPAGTGRQYAKASGDYNPHHLHTVLARLFGFKSAIAHGMWSLARVVASLDREFGITGSARVEASFKLPIFMPATIALGYESQAGENSRQTLVNFELRDEQKGLPHLKGRFLNHI